MNMIDGATLTLHFTPFVFVTSASLLCNPFVLRPALIVFLMY